MFAKRSFAFGLLWSPLIVGPGLQTVPSQTPRPDQRRPPTLAEARREFRTRLTREDRQRRPPPSPPEEQFRLVEYPGPLGPMQAYLSRFEPAPDALRPAIVWITGGMPPARGGAYVWTPGPAANEQSASAFRDAGVVMLFPTVRGTAGNPGAQELMLGEVDDVIAAGRFAQGLEGIDPARVYLGGHSTGATLALLVAESTGLFRATFAFGPAARFEEDVERPWPFDMADPQEFRLRSPLTFLGGVTKPTFIVEGRRGNAAAFEELRSACTNALVTFVLLEHTDHFATLAPVNRLLAERIVAERAAPEVGHFRVSADDIARRVTEFRHAEREARDLRAIEELQAEGLRPGAAVVLEFRLGSESAARLERACASLPHYERVASQELVDEDGAAYHRVTLRRRATLDRASIFELTTEVRARADAEDVEDEGWSRVR